jgi:hypothetical protein
VQRRLEIGEADVLIDIQALDLVEHRRVAHVRVARYTRPGAINANGRALLRGAQRADLHRRGMRAQQPAILEVERVVHGARRMIGRNVQRFEIVEVVLDLGAFGDLEAGAPEDLLDAQPRLVIGCRPPCAARRARAA